MNRHVVANQPASGDYRHVDVGSGAALALVVLCVFLYHPMRFDFTFLPLQLLVVFGLGVMLSVSFPPFRRLFVRQRTMTANVERAARAAFVEFRVHSTRGRTGILVFVSRFERGVALVPDIGAVHAGLGGARAFERVAACARYRDPAAFTAALRELGPALAARLPRRADDKNELPDELVEAKT